MLLIILGGCTKLEKIILHKNKYIDDRAMKGLAYGQATLTFVQVSECLNVTDKGLKEIKSLKNLKTLVLFNLFSVNNIDESKQFLQSNLPDCKILGKPSKYIIYIHKHHYNYRVFVIDVNLPLFQVNKIK